MEPFRFTKENARENQQKGVLARTAKQEARRAAPLLAVQEALPSLFSDLLKAARGEGVWTALPVDKRLAALFKAIEYAAGKPIGLDKTTGSEKAEGDGVEAAGSLAIE